MLFVIFLLFQQITNILKENYNVQDLLTSYSETEKIFLREKLKQVVQSYSIKKISFEEYQTQVTKLLESLSKITTLFEDEKKLEESIKNNVMNKYEVDKGISQNKIEKSLQK